MRGRLCNVLQTPISNIMSRIDCKRKLVLHFDLNKTIIPVDSATGETVEAALNVYLSGLAWGRERAGEWESTEQNLKSRPSHHDNVSFYKFEEGRLLREKSMDRAAFRVHLTSFTDRPQGLGFKPYFNLLLEKLQWNLPYDEELHKPLTVPGTREHRYHFILPSFYRLLTRLTEMGRDFCVIFRSYGSDCKSVISSIKASVGCGMPYCSQLENTTCNIRDDIYRITRQENGTFCLAPDDDRKENVVNSCDTFYGNDEQMYDKLSKSRGMVAVRDDMKVWYLNKYDPQMGKPFWIDETDEGTHHIFFDDNIRPGHDDSIVNIRCKNSEHGFQSVQHADEHKFVNRNVVPVIFSDAIMDENYFVKRVAQCEENLQIHLSGV